MVVQRFCRAYMESPPPAVFHYKYQSYKYERNTAGKSASDHDYIGNNNTRCMDGDRYDDDDDVFDANSTNETFILSDGPTPDQAG